MSWAGKTNRHGWGAGEVKVMVTEVGWAGQAPLGTAGGGHCWEEAHSIGQGLARHSPGNGGGTRAQSGATHAWGQQPREGSAWGHTEQPRGAGREVAAPRSVGRPGTAGPRRAHGHPRDGAGAKAEQDCCATGKKSHAGHRSGTPAAADKRRPGPLAAQGCPRPREAVPTPGRGPRDGLPTRLPRPGGCSPAALILPRPRAAAKGGAPAGGGARARRGGAAGGAAWAEPAGGAWPRSARRGPAQPPRGWPGPRPARPPLPPAQPRLG